MSVIFAFALAVGRAPLVVSRRAPHPQRRSIRSFSFLIYIPSSTKQTARFKHLTASGLCLFLHFAVLLAVCVWRGLHKFSFNHRSVVMHMLVSDLTSILQRNST